MCYLGATPDGKILDPNFSPCYGIAEIKCSEAYKDVDPKDVCFISIDSCLSLETPDKIILNRNHSYYDQIQMQLAISTRTWCDFIFYTSKGMVIDRVNFDEEHWDKLLIKVLNFYFEYMLPILDKKQKPN